MRLRAMRGTGPAYIGAGLAYAPTKRPVLSERMLVSGRRSHSASSLSRALARGNSLASRNVRAQRPLFDSKDQALKLEIPDECVRCAVLTCPCDV
eukprot:2512186-Rhodomonas_salina.2